MGSILPGGTHPAPVDAVILLVGDELLAGHTRDANGHFLAGRLNALGYSLRRIVVVPDEDRELAEEIERWRERVPMVLVSGGLGPTHDDRTTEIVAKLYGRPLVMDEAGWQRLLERYASRFGGPEDVPPEVLEAAQKMVRVPADARVLANPVGASSAYALRNGEDGWVVVLPGVPAEVRGIFLEHVEGKLLPPQRVLATAEVDLAVAEAQIAKDLAELERRHEGVAIGSYPKWGELRVTIRLRGPPDAVESARKEVADRWADKVLPPKATGDPAGA